MAGMAATDDSPIYEGFLCPMCLQNFDSVYQLQSHVETAHGSEDKVVLSKLKGFFGKAKNLITSRSEEQFSDVSRNEQGEGSPKKLQLLGSDPFTWDNPELGASRSHFESLRRIRSDRIDRTVVEINKLVIRLEKLIRYGPPWSDQAKRKVYEKTIVPWAEDSDVRFCPSCGDKFSLAVRRHHCRLCGSIMCNKCSNFVGIPFCEQVLEAETKGKTSSKQADVESSPSKKSDVVTLRVCEHCTIIMEKRLKMVRERNSKPVIVQLYQKMVEVREQIVKQLPIYEKIATSILNGEEEYTYERAERERTVLLKYFDALDLLSKKIYSLGSGTEKTLSSAQMKLRRNIRTEVVRFLQDHMLGLQPLPSEEEVIKLRAERKAAIAKRLEEERQARAKRMQEEALALEKSAQQRAQQQAESKLLDSPKRGHERKSSWGLLNKLKEQAHEVGAGMMVGLTSSGSEGKLNNPPSGWKPSAVSQDTVQALSDDPLIQQMNIISSYLNQAQEAGRWDEVNMLEANLKDLQLAYRQEQSKRGGMGGYQGL
ncbi:rabenosyn-5-like [Lytechinus pictus]|uniref:rabenosyn-5-like n=1 Tax=Lytechinus pictus TaxID=7653 RepID=UPI0030B9BFCD